jgi:hypothetical protein
VQTFFSGLQFVAVFFYGGFNFFEADVWEGFPTITDAKRTAAHQ